MVEQGVITEEEAALYDRQIRLWGLDAQRRLRASRVLLIGVGGLGAEVAKNIVLSGIKSLTLLDHVQVTKEDSCCQFLASRDDIGKNRAESSLHRTQQLNSMVDVRADSENVADKPDDFFKDFDVVCATCCGSSQLTRINKICADNNIKFYAGDVFGYYGYMFSDLGEHEFAVEVQKKKKAEDTDGEGEPSAKKTKTEEEPEVVIVKKSSSFTRLKSALEYDWSSKEGSLKVRRTPGTYFIMHVLLQFLEQEGRRPSLTKSDTDEELLNKLKVEKLEQLQVKPDLIAEEFSKHCFSELSPVCAVVGGVLGQEIIKAVSQKDQPHNNFFFYNGVEGSGLVDKIGYT